MHFLIYQQYYHIINIDVTIIYEFVVFNLKEFKCNFMPIVILVSRIDINGKVIAGSMKNVFSWIARFGLDLLFYCVIMLFIVSGIYEYYQFIIYAVY